MSDTLIPSTDTSQTSQTTAQSTTDSTAEKPQRQRKKKRYVRIAVLLAIAVMILLGAYRTALGCVYNGDEPALIYIDADDTQDSVTTKLSDANVSTFTFRAVSLVLNYQPRTGFYKITKETDAKQLVRKLFHHQQDPLLLRVPSTRTIGRLAASLADQLMLDSTTIHNAFTDETVTSAYGYNSKTIYALIIPNSYEVYWDLSAEELIERLAKENKAFWTEERLACCKELNLSPTEVYTLASIVDEETANNSEKPDIAGLYLNRLRIGMPLQADPTVKVAVGDWSLRRIKGEHLHFDSPYNTYLYKGLPPGPLRIASIQGIDAVLHHTHHNYIYMCAKEDFSGTHNFAATFAEHQQNARRYVQALNRRGIH